VLSAADRDAARALAQGRPGDVTDASTEALLGLVDRAMAAHAGFER
jgi:hypothetical protein